MGMFDKWLWGDPDRDDDGLAIAEALDSATARLRGDLEADDCASEAQGCFYLFLPRGSFCALNRRAALLCAQSPRGFLFASSGGR
jgi:hypothetical protein